MILKEILKKINNFNTTENTEEYEIVVFFDEIEKNFYKLEPLDENEKRLVIETLFNYLNRQPSDLEENWTFIHWIEAIDTTPNYENYLTQLIKTNKQTPNLTSLILLNRHINASSRKIREKGISLLKAISENNNIAELVRDEAKGYYDYQVKKARE